MIQKFREMNIKEREKQLILLRKDLMLLRLEYGATRNLSHPHKVKKTKKDIARLLTLESEENQKDETQKSAARKLHSKKMKNYKNLKDDSRKTKEID